MRSVQKSISSHDSSYHLRFSSVVESQKKVLKLDKSDKLKKWEEQEFVCDADRAWIQNPRHGMQKLRRNEKKGV